MTDKIIESDVCSNEKSDIIVIKFYLVLLMQNIFLKMVV